MSESLSKLFIATRLDLSEGRNIEITRHAELAVRCRGDRTLAEVLAEADSSLIKKVFDVEIVRTSDLYDWRHDERPKLETTADVQPYLDFYHGIDMPEFFHSF